MDLKRFVSEAKSEAGQNQDGSRKHTLQFGKTVKQAESVRVMNVQK